MGKTKTAIVSQELQEERATKKKAKYEAKKQAHKVRVPGLGGGQRVVAVEAEMPLAQAATEKPRDQETKRQKVKGKGRVRGKKYLAAKAKVDPKKLYPVEEAVQLAKDTSYSTFPGSLEVHLVLARGTVNKTIELPYSTGQVRRVEITNEQTIKKLQEGKIDFDVLITHPSYMPKLVPFARLLGPKGLMPNPKAGTISENPEQAAAKFGGNTLQLKNETKAPLVHTTIGRVDQPEKELVENLSAVSSAVGQHNIKKAFIKATMGPAVKVAVS